MQHADPGAGQHPALDITPPASPASWPRRLYWVIWTRISRGPASPRQSHHLASTDVQSAIDETIRAVIEADATIPAEDIIVISVIGE